MAATPGTNTSVTLSEMFKVHYAKQETNLLDYISTAAQVYKAAKFSEAEGGLGLEFQQPVVVSSENGFTYAGAAAGAFDLNGSVQSSVVKAKLVATSLVLQSRIDYETAARAKKGDKAFINGTEWLVKNMMESTTRRLESMFLYGGAGIGTLSAVNAGTFTVTISAATFSAGLLAGLEGAYLDIYQADNTTLRTANVLIDHVDVDAKTIVFDSSTVMTGIAATDLIYFRGAKGNECLGLQAILSQQTGTLFNVNITKYSLFRGNVVDMASAVLTVSAITKGCLKAVNKGLQEDATLWVSVNAWLGFVNPVTDASSANSRSKPADQGRKLQYGADGVEIIAPSGKVTIKPHLMVKDGDAFLVPTRHLKRVGATDVTFETPGMEKTGEIFLQLQANAGFELRCYANQALFVDRPGICVYFKNIAPVP
jgi:hypothetical protein